MGKIKVYRGLMETVELDLSNAVFSKRLQGEHNLVFTVRSTSPLDIKVGDYLTYKGEVMEVNKPIDLDKISSFEYRSQIVFQGLRHRLSRWIVEDEGAVIFPYIGDLSSFMNLFLESLNAKDVDSGWTATQLDDVNLFSIDFDCTNFWDAINMIAEASGCEWQLKGKDFSVKKTVGQPTAIQLAYGKDNGLYGLSRQSVDNLNIVNSAYGIGGSQNLPRDFGQVNLMLPSKVQDLASIATIGLREGVFKDETIFPKGDGTVTDIGQINESTWSISDASIDFDFQGQFIQGVEPKIIFLSGALNGQEFKVLDYKHNSKTIRYEANKDSNGQLTPFGLYRAEIGDKYFISGIRMPQSYVDAALLELENKTQEYVNSNKNARPIYDLDIDLLDAKRKAIYPNEGDLVRVRDTEIGIDEDLRVTFISFPANFPEVLEQGKKFTCEVGHDIAYSRIALVEKNIKETKEVVTQVSKTTWENDRRNIVALQEFLGKVFDPDGNLQEPLIKAIVGFFGTESMIYDLEGVTYVVNAGGDANSFSISSGQLIHKVYKIEGLGYIWNLTVLSVAELDPIKSYYLSAKCSQAALTGEWVLTENQMQVDAEPGYWHFNLGVLSSVVEGVRSLQSTMGYTMIANGNIVTDSITAYRINVRKLFAQLITVGKDDFVNAGISGLADREELSQRFWAGETEENRYSAPFQVLDDGSMKASKGEIGGFEITSYSLVSKVFDPGAGSTSTSRGIIVTNQGVLSRNTGMSFLPATTGLDFSGSIVGETSQSRPAAPSMDAANVRTGIIGVRRQDLTSQAINQLNGSYGHYGGLFSSVKMLGSVYLAARFGTDTATIVNNQDHIIVIVGSNYPEVILPENPEHGMQIIIKNGKSEQITINGNGKNIALMDNTTRPSYLADPGIVKQLIFMGNNYWVELSRE